MFDGEAFGAEIVAHVKSHVSNSIAPLLSEILLLKARIVELEAREPERGEKGEPGDPGHDGKDADIAVIAKMVAEEVSKLPPAPAGKDGESIIGPPGPIGPPGESVVGPPGHDGVGIASAFIDREGNLVLTFTDGTVGSVGKVAGGQGPPGKDGIDGKDGKDGRDGFGFDDLTVTGVEEDGHSILLKFVRGEAVKIFRIVFPNTFYCGIYGEGEEYVIGDLVTWAGSLWHCNNPTKNKPGVCQDWTLVAKKGRDGHDGKDGKNGPPGPIGPPGRDLTQMGFDGTKF